MSNEEEIPLLEHEEEKDETMMMMTTQPILFNLMFIQHQGPQAKKFQ